MPQLLPLLLLLLLVSMRFLLVPTPLVADAIAAAVVEVVLRSRGGV